MSFFAQKLGISFLCFAILASLWVAANKPLHIICLPPQGMTTSFGNGGIAFVSPLNNVPFNSLNLRYKNWHMPRWSFGSIFGSGSNVPGVWSVWIPLWPFILVSLVFFVRSCMKPKPVGCCQVCGYDLRGNISGICPECGNTCGTGMIMQCIN